MKYRYVFWKFRCSIHIKSLAIEQSHLVSCILLVKTNFFRNVHKTRLNGVTNKRHCLHEKKNRNITGGVIGNVLQLF